MARLSQSAESMSSTDLSNEDFMAMYRYMLMARTVDQRMWIMNRQGRGPFAISCQGHEAAQVGSAFALTAGRDWICPYYRDAGAAIALGTSILDIMLAFCAKAEDPFGGGRQLPNHYSSRRLRILSGSSSVGSQIPHATGIGLAAKLRGEESVVVTYFGEGATSTGDFHAGVNFASIHKLPVIFFAENNGWAISVPTAKQMNLDSLADRAIGYGVPGVVVDGTDILAVHQVTRAALDRCLAGEGPTLIDAEVYRPLPHSSDDDDSLYLPPGLKESFQDRDPIERFRAELIALGIWDDDRDSELRKQIQQEVNEAASYAESRPEPDPADLWSHVYADSPETTRI